MGMAIQEIVQFNELAERVKRLENGGHSEKPQEDLAARLEKVEDQLKSLNGTMSYLKGQLAAAKK